MQQARTIDAAATRGLMANFAAATPALMPENAVARPFTASETVEKRYDPFFFFERDAGDVQQERTKLLEYLPSTFERCSETTTLRVVNRTVKFPTILEKDSQITLTSPRGQLLFTIDELRMQRSTSLACAGFDVSLGDLDVLTIVFIVDDFKVEIIFQPSPSPIEVRIYEPVFVHPSTPIKTITEFKLRKRAADAARAEERSRKGQGKGAGFFQGL